MASRALHLRHPADRTSSSKQSPQRVPRHRRHDPLLLLLRRQRRPLRNARSAPEDAIISDELNHASIIDGVRLCKAQRYRYSNNDMADLEAKLKEAAAGARFRLIATDGVFSMDGYHRQSPGHLRPGRQIRRPGDGGRFPRRRLHGHAPAAARHEHRGVMGRVDILTGTLGKALGGGQRRLHQRPPRRSSSCSASARAPISSPTPSPPAIAGASLQVLELLSASTAAARPTGSEHADSSAHAMTEAGFNIVPGKHPIVPIMLGDAALAAAPGRRHAGPRRIRHRLLLPRRARRAKPASASKSPPPTRSRI